MQSPLKLDARTITAIKVAARRGVVGKPLDAEVELLKETGRLLFMRGLVVQGETRVAAFSGTIRKPTKK